MNVLKYLQKKSFEAWVPTKRIFKNIFKGLIGMRKSFQVFFLILYRKNRPIYRVIQIQAEKNDSSHEEQKSEPQHPIEN